MLNPKTNIKEAAVERILALQKPSGAILWLEESIFDPWNHTESAMALSITGYTQEAEQAYAYLAESQLQDGSWWSECGNAVPMEDHTHLARTEAPKLKDTNFIAYPATGVWHHFLASNDLGFLKDYWPMVQSAINYVLNHQSPEGEITWCTEVCEEGRQEALISGCSSIHKSLECAISMGDHLGEETSHWRECHSLLKNALHKGLKQPQAPWVPKETFSMDWYYPILCGVLNLEESKARLTQGWRKFVVEGLGCRCVSDEPWVTVAESCELAMALTRLGLRGEAEALLHWQQQWRDHEGAYWMGYQFEEKIFWPEEKPSWTSAAALLAADALIKGSPTAQIFAR